MKIGLDIDGVVYDWHYSMIRYFREFKNYAGNDVEFWDMFENLSEESQRYYITLPMLYDNVSLTKDLIDYLPKIAELGEIYYITARLPELQSLTRKFFDKYNLPFKENLFFDAHKQNLVRMYGLDYFVDDQPKYLESMVGLTKPLLFLRPHNTRGRGRELFQGVNSFKQIYNIIVEGSINGGVKELKITSFMGTGVETNESD